MRLRSKTTAPVRSILGLWLFFGAFLSASAQSPGPAGVTFGVAAAPDWVKPIGPVAAIKADSDNGGILYLLVDQQVQVEPRASFYHEARQITSENGVQNGAAISASFDPSFQTLVFHFIRLTRNAVASDRLDRSQIKLLQREKDMEAFLYNGDYTAHCQLEDVRVGDVIEFAYSVEGANPVEKGKFARGFDLDWHVPVHRAVTRILYPARRDLHFLAKNRAIKPSITAGKETTEWVWDEVDVPARKPDPDTPLDHDPCGSVQVCEYSNWEELIDWGVSLYQMEAPLSAELEAQAGLLGKITEVEQRILAALRFVQDEVRYLGIESGAGSLQPTSPNEVLRRRFGDCKDKAHLLGTLLRRTGIDARPALVSSTYRRTVAERLPSPGAFNHVILRVQTEKDVHWLDATRSSQRGPLSQVAVGDFGFALVLRPGNKTLTAYSVPPGSLPRKKIVENYRIPAPEGSGELEVISEFHGQSAENVRSRFQDKGREQIQKEYLQYYARRFPGIRRTRALSYEELPGENGCKVKESYLIPKVWQLSEEKTHYEVALYPSDLDYDMGSPGSSQRDDPLALDHPVDTTQEINAEMFEAWTVNLKSEEVSNAFFHYRDGGTIRGRHLQFTYSYKSLADRVPVADLPRYNAALNRLKDKMGYRLTYRRPWLSDRFDSRLLALVGCSVLAASLFFGICFVGAVIWVVHRASLKRAKPGAAP